MTLEASKTFGTKYKARKKSQYTDIGIRQRCVYIYSNKQTNKQKRAF